MSISAVAPTPFYQDPDRLPIGLPAQAPVASDSTSSSATAKNTDGKNLHMFAAEDNSPSFWDLLDVINPLQHIPVISNIYREMTGDQIGVGARLVGGTLFGGPVGLIASAVDCMVEESTGKDTGEHVLALFRDEGSSSPDVQPASQFAQAGNNSNTGNQTAIAADTVSSSPAKVAAAAPAASQNPGAGPVIALPDGQGTGNTQPMVFTADGLQAADSATPPHNAVASAAGPAPVQLTAANAQAMAAQTAAKYQTSSKGFMPVPPRAAPGDAKPAPLITVPVSSGTQRSNVPITGRSPINEMSMAAAPRPAVKSDTLAAPAAATSANGTSQTAGGPDWFTSAWSQALDKYERTNQRNSNATTGGTTSTLQ